MQFAVNKDIYRRDSLLADLADEDRDLRFYRFDGMAPEVLELIISEGFANADDQHGDCLTNKEILEFLKENSSFTAHGYAVGIHRDDYRVSIEGVEATGHLDANQVSNFAKAFEGASEFELTADGARAWFD